MINFVNSRSLVEESVEQSYSYYSGYNGSDRSSGCFDYSAWTSSRGSTLTNQSVDISGNADHPNAYWTGYFTSRPALKGYERMMSGYYLQGNWSSSKAGRILGPNTDALANALAISQHHDAVCGTEREHVAADYAKRLSMGYAEVVVVYNPLGWKREEVIRIPAV
nr:alpha-mannosidase [Quercus suber]